MFSIYLGILYLLATSFIFVPVNPAPTAQDKTDSGILYYENENDGKGNYEFSFATDDTKREELGTVVNAGQPDQYIQVEGSYSYRYNTPAGYKWRMYEYTAGKEGFNITELMVIEGTLSGHIPAAALATLTG